MASETWTTGTRNLYYSRCSAVSQHRDHKNDGNQGCHLNYAIMANSLSASPCRPFNRHFDMSQQKNTGKTNHINNGPVQLKRHHTAEVHYISQRFYMVFCLRTVLDQSSFRKTVTKSSVPKTQTWIILQRLGSWLLQKVILCLRIDYIYCLKN